MTDDLTLTDLKKKRERESTQEKLPSFTGVAPNYVSLGDVGGLQTGNHTPSAAPSPKNIGNFMSIWYPFGTYFIMLICVLSIHFLPCFNSPNAMRGSFHQPLRAFSADYVRGSGCGNLSLVNPVSSW